MKVTLLSHTPEPEKLIASAAKLCYSNKADIDSLMNDLTPEKVNSFIEHLESLGHSSPFENASFTFGIEGVSRALLAQYSRSRIGVSLAVRSQRYCAEDNFEYVIPESISLKERTLAVYKNAMDNAKDAYKTLIENGVPKEDARMVLPNATCTRFITTLNVRSLIYLSRLRMCQRAQSEIREMVFKMIEEARKVAPLLFKHAGPPCVMGYCPEGSMSCGRVPTLNEVMKAYNNEEWYEYRNENKNKEVH